ncbi:MAG: RNA methyltransferase [Nitrospiraceae bacterium]|jgi:TrmH family RNA methyltransferase|nr:MAG: RNA methyltransferase [Nitrospiraceae bacterium]
MEGWKDKVSFILIDTLESGNIGASARALKNLGFSRLELVRPGKFPSDEAGWFSHGAEDVISKATVHRDLDDALKDASVVIGTTRRAGKKRGKVYPVREAAERIRQLSVNTRVALLFGREDRGLTNEETAACSFMIRIPASLENPSFNLAQAVLIIAYELSCTSYVISPTAAVISNEELSNLFQRLRGILKMAGYEPKGIRDNEKEIMADLRRIIARAAITEREARMLHGIISQLEDSLGKKQGSCS